MKAANKIRYAAGFTLIEVLIAVILTSIVAGAALQFYVSEHNNMIVQHDISDMQQNLRASMEEISHAFRNAGSNLPDGILAIEAFDLNPDSVTIRYSRIGGNVDVGDHTQKKQASPIHVSTEADLSEFDEGQTCYLWHAGTNTGEWFTITGISYNNGNGWMEISHQGQELTADPWPGDVLILMEQNTYFVSSADTANPLFMRKFGPDSAAVYAENIEDFQLEYTLSDGSKTAAPAAGDTVFAVNISMTAHTASVDVELADRSDDGRRYRTHTTDVLLRNNRFANY